MGKAKILFATFKQDLFATGFKTCGKVRDH